IAWRSLARVVRAIDPAGPGVDAFEPVSRRIVSRHLLDDEFGDAIRLGWTAGVLFIDHVGLESAVDLFRADVHHAPDAEQAHRFKQMDRAFDIDSERIDRRADRRRYADNRRAMDDL